MNAALPHDALSERHVRALLEAAGQIHFRLSADGRQMRGLSGGGFLEDAEQTVSDWIDRYIPPEDRDLVAQAIAGAVKDKRALDLEHRARRLDGGLAWLRSRLIPLMGPGGEIEEWLGMARDITARRESKAQLAEREERLRLALDVAGLSTWDWHLDTGDVAWSADHFSILGYTPGEVTPSYAAWTARVHPADLPATEARIAQARDSGNRYEAEFRVLPGKEAVRWCRAQGRFLYDDAGRPLRMIGVMQDVTAAKEAEARQRQLLAELQHRVRNTLAVIRSIVRRSALKATSIEDYAAHLEGRVNALTRVQGALTHAPGAGVDLETILRDELQAAAVGGDRLILSGPAVRLPSRAAEMMALVVHELATNAIKHGAFAASQGAVAVEWSVEAGDPPHLRLRWSEKEGRKSGPPRRKGFGIELLERMLPYSLGARTRIEHRPEGFRCEIDLPLPFLSG